MKLLLGYRMYVQSKYPIVEVQRTWLKHLIEPANINTHSVHFFVQLLQCLALSPLRRAEALAPSAPAISEAKLENLGHRGSVSGAKKRCQRQSHVHAC